MTLPLPNLDTRRYDDILAEALRRVSRYTPEWTNHNDSDPGKALIGLNAWLIETLLYQINQVPQQNYVAFLNLLGVKPQPARAASTELTFALKPLALPTDALTVNLPNATRVAVDDPNLSPEVVFETQNSARALNGAVGLALVPCNVSGFSPVTEFDNKTGRTTWLHAFDPFDAGKHFVFALVLRPTLGKPIELYAEDRMPTGSLDLFFEATEVLDKNADGAVLKGPLQSKADPIGLPVAQSHGLIWEAFTGAEADKLTFDGANGWQKLGVLVDETASLTRSGHLGLDLPANLTPVPFDALGSSVWQSLLLQRPPRSLNDLTQILAQNTAGIGDQIKAALTESEWTAMGIPAVKFNTVLSTCITSPQLATALVELANQGLSANPAALSSLVWAKLVPDFSGPKIPIADNAAKLPCYRKMYFFRATRVDCQPRLINALRLNTVRAVAASTREDELLGQSNGRPGQSFSLSRTPVWFDPATEAPDLELEITADDGTLETWTRVPDFYGQGPDKTVYILDPISGRIQFGDGRPRGLGGAIPPPAASIRAKRYRFGGGAIGNVGPGSVAKIKGAIQGVASVANLRATSGGADAESLNPHHSTRTCTAAQPGSRDVGAGFRRSGAANPSRGDPQSLCGCRIHAFWLWICR